MPVISAYLIAAGVAWLAAQGTKFLLNRSSVGTRRVRLLYQSGNMPSSHTAMMTALTTVVGMNDGVDSAVFAVAAVVTVIIAYDAMMARRSSGEQGLALRKLIGLSPFSKDPLPYQALGHKPLEVAAGGMLGIVIGLVVAILITK